MSQLTEVLEKVRDEKLQLEQLEKLHDTLTHIYTRVCIELAEKRKAEAIFFIREKDAMPEASDISIKRKFRASADGQRLLELQSYKAAIPAELSALKNRIYSAIR